MCFVSPKSREFCRLTFIFLSNSSRPLWLPMTQSFSVFMFCVLHPLTNLRKDAIKLILKTHHLAVFSLVSFPLQFTLQECVKDQDCFLLSAPKQEQIKQSKGAVHGPNPESGPWKSFLHICLAEVTSKLHAAFLPGSYPGFIRKCHKQ